MLLECCLFGCFGIVSFADFDLLWFVVVRAAFACCVPCLGGFVLLVCLLFVFYFIVLVFFVLLF